MISYVVSIRSEVLGREKRLAKIKQNPKHVRFKELDRLLKSYGFQIRNPRSGSSHFYYFKEGLPDQISVPHKKPFLKEYCVNKVIEIIEKLEEAE